MTSDSLSPNARRVRQTFDLPTSQTQLQLTSTALSAKRASMTLNR